MPQLLTVRVKRPDGRPIRIWVPVLPVVLVFSPVVVLAVLVAAVACLVYRVSVLRALDRANAELVKQGVPIDLGQLKPEQLEALVEHLDELIVDIDQPDGQVRIFCE